MGKKFKVGGFREGQSGYNKHNFLVRLSEIEFDLTLKKHSMDSVLILRAKNGLL